VSLRSLDPAQHRPVRILGPEATVGTPRRVGLLKIKTETTVEEYLYLGM